MYLVQSTSIINFFKKLFFLKIIKLQFPLSLITQKKKITRLHPKISKIVNHFDNVLQKKIITSLCQG